jgi:hypothetical protein
LEKIIYAIVQIREGDGEAKFLSTEIHGLTEASVYLVPYQDIAIAVSDFHLPKFTVTKELALGFAQVIESLSGHFNLLPVRFGTFLKSDEQINQLIIKNYDSFVDHLIRIANKFEFGLKVLWDYEKAIETIKAKMESHPATADTYFSKKSIHTEYLFEKMMKHRLEEALIHFADQLIDDLSGHLENLEPICKFKKMVTPQMVLDALFLVRKEEKEEFVAAIGRLKQQRPELSFLLTGPWPPYNFTEISIEMIR